MKTRMSLLSRHSASLVAVGLLTLHVEAGAQLCVSAPPGLVSWWPADGNANDIQGSNDGTLLNGATFAPGIVGQAFIFDGLDDFVQIPNAPSLTLPSAFTVDFWFSPTSTMDASNPNAPGLFSKGAFDTINLANDDGRIEVRGPIPRPTSVTDTWIAGSWHHVAVTFDATGYKLYVNGELESSEVSDHSILSNANALAIGSMPLFSPSEVTFPGRIDEVDIFDRALLQEEIQNIFDAGIAGKCKQGNPPSSGFLTVPISGSLLIREKFISSVQDHHLLGAGSYYGPPSGSVLAFNGELGEATFGANCHPAGYRNESLSNFFAGGEIAYQGAECNPPTGFDPRSFLNYDGHLGFDFAYAQDREILAPATGLLEVPITDPVNSSMGGDPQSCFNTLRIVHQGTGYETWYLHSLPESECAAFERRGLPCPAPGDSVPVEAGEQIARVGNRGVIDCGVDSGGYHLHFEVRRSADLSVVVDPFGCSTEVAASDPGGCGGVLWSECTLTEILEIPDQVLDGQVVFAVGGSVISASLQLIDGAEVEIRAGEGAVFQNGLQIALEATLSVIVGQGACL